MGLFIKILLLLLVLALAAPFVIKGPDGQPLLTLGDIQKPGGLSAWVQSIPQIATTLQGDMDKKSSAPVKGRTQAYTWQDEQGNVHYSNIAPTKAASVETIQVNPNVNIIEMDQPAEGE